ncbi:MAG TPA: thiamine pyrophosphate-binding protein [Chloroflexota bacterium]|nr:thiamine pyrophosphate-binding protein [Chloroflexota bacterium]
MARLTGGELAVRTLSAAGVDLVFGIVSVHNVPIYDAMNRLGSVRPVPVRHEQAAVLMADGYSRASGRLGVALTSTGPGAANAMGSMVEAYTASSPVLHLTGQVESQYLGKAKGFLHEARDQLAMLAASSKWAGRPNSTREIPVVLGEAIRQAVTGRRRPVSVELPIDLQNAEDEADVPVFEGFARLEPSSDEITRAAQIVAGAKRPLIWAGGGVIASEASAELRTLAELLRAGVITSNTGRGSLPEDHPLCIGNLSVEAPVQDLAKEADVLIAIGTRFQGSPTQNWRMTLPDTIVHMDIDPTEIGKNYPAAQGVTGDARPALAALVAALGGRVQTEMGWPERVAQTRAAARAALRERIGQHAKIMDSLRAALPRDAIVVKDATISAYTWGNRLLEVYEPRTSMNPTCGAIGPGLPLALGAATARPDRQVVCIAGDGGFVYNMAELATAVQQQLPVVVLLFNDGGYGILRHIQDRAFEGRRIAVDLHTPDFAKVAEAFGVWSRRVDRIEAFNPALTEALAAGGPALIEIDSRAIGPMPTPYAGTSRQQATRP